MLLSRLLQKNCKDIKFTARFGYDGIQRLLYHGAIYEERRFAFADPEILKIFRFKYIKGNHLTAFKQSNSIIINKTTAARFFLDTDAIGQTIEFENGKTFVVGAVIEDIPDQYKFKFDFLANISHIEQKYQFNWNYDIVNTYALINKDSSLFALEKKINSITKGLNCGTLRIGNIPTISQYENIIAYNDNMENDPMNYIFSIIIMFILLTAIINYANNQTVLSSKRALEVGMRKVFGANNRNIALQYLLESLTITFICLIIAICLTVVLIPYFNNISGLALRVDYSFDFFGRISVVALISGIIASIYPSFFMAGFKPINILKGDFRSGPRGEVFRKMFIIFQFSVSITLIVSSFVVFEQYELIQNKKLAYENEYKIDVDCSSIKDLSKIKQSLKNYENILAIKEGKKNLTITILSTDIRKTVQLIKNLWNRYYPDKEFDFSFHDKYFNNIYKINDMKSNILYFFTIIIVFVSYLGLFVNSAFMVKQKSGEIALRKAFGARFIDIQKLISSEYLRLVFVSNIIAFFFVVWPMNTWFRRFAYRINISYEAFLYTLIITMILTMLTVGYHTIKSWLTRPSQNLLRE